LKAGWCRAASASDDRLQSGTAAVLVALFLPVLMGCFLLLTELGWQLVVHGNLRAAADLAALAAAQCVALEDLAAGQIRLIPEAVHAEAVRFLHENARCNPFLADDWSQYRIRVSVLNASVASPERDPWTGETVDAPTVCLFVSHRVHSPTRLFPGRWIHVHCHASLAIRSR